MKRKTTIVTEEYDEKGAIKTKITEATEEEDAGYIYPQYAAYPWLTPPTRIDKIDWNASGPVSAGDVGLSPMQLDAIKRGKAQHEHNLSHTHTLPIPTQLSNTDKTY